MSGGSPRKILLWLSYRGDGFHGFAKQPGQTTVQGTLEAALADVVGEAVPVVGASRTDAGVHARRTAAHFVTAQPIAPQRWAAVLNAQLPPQLRILSSQQVPLDFHARYTAIGKEYRYFVLHSRAPSPLLVPYVYRVHRTLDLVAMQQAVQALRGTHDFTSFAKAEAGGRRVRTLRRLELYVGDPPALHASDGQLLTFVVEGPGFLYNMVRILVGTLLAVGNHQFDPEAIPSMLKARDRQQAGPTAPSQGLVLWEVRYPTIPLLFGRSW
ncbi:MAG: tRNA pseudouridine(38-40) synthase TruA [Firmicutes bacterium]|nr:tRNA pseudouridine(38-40) synthase TruA [Bacillota bacterium]